MLPAHLSARFASSSSRPCAKVDGLGGTRLCWWEHVINQTTLPESRWFFKRFVRSTWNFTWISPSANWTPQQTESWMVNFVWRVWTPPPWVLCLQEIPRDPLRRVASSAQDPAKTGYKYLLNLGFRYATKTSYLSCWAVFMFTLASLWMYVVLIHWYIRID